MNTPHDQFKTECESEVASQGSDQELAASTRLWMDQANAKKYSYHFEWMGRPIIQYPQDILAMQELIWKIQPDLIVETGIAHGGSILFSASMLTLNAACGGPVDASVIGIDIDIRPHNKAAIEAHPMASRVRMIQGSSIDPEVIEQVHAAAKGKSRVMVILDSNHTHDHVLAELEAYAKLTSIGSHCIVMDTVVEDLPATSFSDRPWSKGNNPKTAVWAYLKSHPQFEIDTSIQNKLLITVAPDGYLKRIS